jgi:glycosyltransferase involved in cell wall biosynthesis
MVIKAPQISPFVSVVLRTQGDRQETLAESLLCLGSQTFGNFEILIICQTASEDRYQDVKRLVSSFPADFAAKARVIHCQEGTRATPLNIGLREGNGEYFTFFDDDDLVLPNWLQVFFDLSRERYGRVLRSSALTQRFRKSKHENPTHVRSISEPVRQYNSRFSLIQHLVENQSPFMSLAFPRTILDNHNLRFDESLSTTEDWEFLLTAASLVGVYNSEEVTCIYRRWTNSKDSLSIPEYEWRFNHSTILQRFNSKTISLQPGEVFELQAVFEKWNTPASLPPQEGHLENREALQILIQILESRAWRWTSPLRRIVGVIKGQPKISLLSVDIGNTEQVKQLIKLIENSFWLRTTRIFRKNKKI